LNNAATEIPSLVADLPQGPQRRRELLVFEPTDRVGRKVAASGQLILRQAPDLAQPRDVLTEWLIRHLLAPRRSLVRTDLHRGASTISR
jgi:hypothetical protein